MGAKSFIVRGLGNGIVLVHAATAPGRDEPYHEKLFGNEGIRFAPPRM